MRHFSRYFWILSLVGALLGTQAIALLHTQAHGNAHDWVSEQLGDHACAVIDQLATATPTSQARVQLPQIHAEPKPSSDHQSWLPTCVLSWNLARAPPKANLPHSASQYIHLLL
jgi:hypothetical protein